MRLGTVAAMAKAATPWGPAELVEELTLAQRAGGKRFSSLVQLLEAPGGERLLRLAHSAHRTAPRGAPTPPVGGPQRAPARAPGPAQPGGGPGAEPPPAPGAPGG